MGPGVVAKSVVGCWNFMSKVILGWVPTCDLWLYSAAPLGKHHDLISHSVSLSWRWAKQSIPYPINAEPQARTRQISIWLVNWEPNCRSPTPKTLALPMRPPPPRPVRISENTDRYVRLCVQTPTESLICHYLVWHSALIAKDKDWFAQYQDNVIEWDISGWAAL